MMCRTWVALAMIVWVASFGEVQNAAAAQFETKHYLLVTDVRREDAKEAVVRLDRAYEQFVRFFDFLETHERDPATKLRAILVTTRADYLKAGGVAFADACYKVADKALLVHFNDKTDWRSVVHEASHQFTHEVTCPNVQVPTWFNEGMATYHGDGLFTGDGYHFGRVTTWQMRMYGEIFTQRKFVPFDRLFDMTRAEWNHHYRIELYHQSWSIVHYLLHSTRQNRHGFERFIDLMVQGTDAKTAWETAIAKDSAAFLNGWKQYWDTHPGENEREMDEQAAILTTLSGLIRANETFGRRITNLDAYFREVQTQKLQLNDTPETWLSPSLLFDAATKRDRTAQWQLKYDRDNNPVITVRKRTGGTMEARIEDDGKARETRLIVTERAK